MPRMSEEQTVANDTVGASPQRARRRLWALLAALLALALVLLAGMAEGVLRLTISGEEFLPYHRNSVTHFFPSEKVTPGVSGVSRFSTNSLGTRGPELDGERVRILTIGGSTTACTVLDDAETWPALLMTYVNRDAGDSKLAWVTNSGIDGKYTHHHIMHAKYLLPRLPRIDFTVVYAGLNDVGAWLYVDSFDPDYLKKPENWNHRVGESFRVSSFTPTDWPWYKRLQLWKSASIAKNLVSSYIERQPARRDGFVQDADLRWMEEAQQLREEREKKFVHRAKMDTLPTALKSYRDNITWIVKLVREAGSEPVLVAQAIQHNFLDESERKRLWMGAMDGGKTYVREEQMLQLLQAFNNEMREVAVQQGAIFVDLPDILQGSRDLFYDGMHFNENGARTVALALATRLGPLIAKRAARKLPTE